MKHSIMTLLTATLVAAALATPSFGKGDKDSNSKREKEVINQVYEVGKNPRLSLSNLNGGATITGWDKNTIEVTATKRGSSRERLDEATVKCEMKNDHLRIEVDYDFDDDDQIHYNDSTVEVEFEIRVPRGIEVDRVELINGGIDISDLNGDVSASSVNGDVTGDRLAGEIHLSTVNGDVSLRTVVGDDSIELSSVNGSVDISLPRNVNAKVSASTVHGDVHGQLAKGVTHAGSSMDAVLGNGGMRIELSTVNGDIRVRRDGSGGRGDDDSDNDSE